MVKIEKTKEIIKKIPQQKAHIEFISALLTIPVLITVIMLNLNNLRSKPAVSVQPTLTPTVTSEKAKDSQVTPTTVNTDFSAVTPIIASATPIPTATDQCVKGIGPVDVTFPQEGQTVNNNPLCIDINYESGNYCSVVWAYKINGGPLSDYSNNSVCLYNLPQGNNSFTLQVKSLVANVSKTIVRHFNYQGNSPTQIPTLAPSNSASGSAGTQ